MNQHSCKLNTYKKSSFNCLSKIYIKEKKMQSIIKLKMFALHIFKQLYHCINYECQERSLQANGNISVEVYDSKSEICANLLKVVKTPLFKLNIVRNAQDIIRNLTIAIAYTMYLYPADNCQIVHIQFKEITNQMGQLPLKQLGSNITNVLFNENREAKNR